MLRAGIEQALQADNNEHVPPSTEQEPERPQSPDLDPEVQRQRQERKEQLKAESDERWAARKRRRRTRGWAGLPADPAGPPRFPSETTIDESKAYLALDNNLYRRLRDQFARLCIEEDVVKKTEAGPEKWQAVKDRLIRENQHLQSVMWVDPAGTNEHKLLALDVICTDVTKRMRTLERRMTIADAKNILGINPEESRQIRNAFYSMLKSDRFTSKLEAGDSHWNELKEKWIASTPLMQRIVDQDPQESQEHDQQTKAIEVLCRDVMKRLRDDQTRKDPSRAKQLNAGPGPGPAPPRTTSSGPQQSPYAASTTSAAASQAVAAAAEAASDLVNSYQNNGLQHADLQIDPSLLLAASDPSMALDVNDPSSYASSYPQQQGLGVWTRLSDHSQIQAQPKLWIGSLSPHGSFEELRQLAGSQHPGAVVQKIEGVFKDHLGQETLIWMDDDAKVGVFLQHVMDLGGGVTFEVRLGEGAGGYA